MKKIIILIATIFVFSSTNVKANTIYNIDVDVYIEKNGDASITETWYVKGTDGTEWYHPFRDLESGHYEISNYTVTMDGEPLTRKKWNVNESLHQKAGYYGINYTSTDTELCFGKSDFKEHTFVLKYQVENFIFNTSDAQVMYWTFFPKFQNVDFKAYTVNIRSDFEFPETLDLWSFGSKTYYFSKDGKATFTIADGANMNNSYLVALAKFDLNTFDTKNTNSNFSTFDSVLNTANKDTYNYDYNNTNSNTNNNKSKNKSSNWGRIFGIFGEFLWLIPMAIIGAIGGVAVSNMGYGYKNNKTIDKNAVPNFRDIPCNKDIYYANALLFLNKFDYKETNILGAIILKWVKQEKVGFIKQDVGIFKKEQSCLDLRNNPTFEAGSLEGKLFSLMYEASKDGILEPNEFKKWARSNYDSFFSVFKNFKEHEVSRLRSEGHIYARTNKEECKHSNVMDDKIYEDSVQLYGLKKFLIEFASMDTKETLEVHIWDEYLMFAYLFGIADRVAQQLKKLYPEIMEQNTNIDYTTIMMINHFSATTVSAASSARSAAESYHGGGGGFGLGGGGFGAGGGGGFSGGGSR